MADLERIKGSNGSGEAVRAVVQSLRLSGSSTLDVDSTTNWPAKFIGLYGTPDGNGSVIPSSVRVFYGEISGSDINITNFAAGYTDNGNSVGDIVVLKPTTAWADEIADFLGVSHNVDGSLKDDSVTTDAITDSNVTTAKIADAAVTGDKVDFSTINHYGEITTTFSTASTSDVAVTGLALTFTVPTGGASYMLTFSSPSVYNSGSNYNTVRVWDGTIGSGTKVLEVATFGSNGTALPITYSKKITLTAGSHTLNVSLVASAGTANILADSTARQTSISAVRVI